MVDRGLVYLPCFPTITSGVVSKITIIARLCFRAKELYESFSGTGVRFGEDLLRLAVFQVKNDPPRVELVIDLAKHTSDCPAPESVKTKDSRGARGSK